MARRSVHFDRKAFALRFSAATGFIEVSDQSSGDYLAHLDDVSQASATDLSHALAEAGAQWDDSTGAELKISEIEHSLFDENYSLAGPVSFVATPDGLALDVSFFLDDFDDEAATADDVRTLITPLLERSGATLVEAHMDENYVVSPWLWHLRILPKVRARTVGQVFQVGTDLLSLVEAVAGRGLERDSVLALLRSARPDVLLGQEEGDWLDVKSQDYDLSSDRGKISIAQDVARFGNAEHGGIIVIGMGTKKTPDGEVINKVHPLPPNPHGVRRHRQAIDHRVFPPPDQLTVEEVAVDGGTIVVVHLPPQPEELKPFLMHGAIVGDRVEGAFISIVRRRGEGSIPVSAQAIHSTLAAGRALLRRGEVPDGD